MRSGSRLRKLVPVITSMKKKSTAFVVLLSSLAFSGTCICMYVCTEHEAPNDGMIGGIGQWENAKETVTP